MKREIIINKISDTLVRAGTTFLPDKIEAYEKAIESETNPKAKWALETILKNAEVAKELKVPICDDTGIPQVVIEIGKNRSISGSMILDIQEGVKEGLRAMPGRPMGIKGNDLQRIDQSGGLSEDPGDVLPVPILFKNIAEDDVLRVHVMLLGGGPAMRGITHRIFHKHDVSVVVDEIVERAIEGVSKLGCTPCTLAIGVGRTQYEATSMMIEAQVYGRHNIQNDIEKEITDKVNKSDVGPIGLGGKHSVLATFMKVGPQRASGIRVVSIRPSCNIEPRIASTEL